jgi:hypothetical protein
MRSDEIHLSKVSPLNDYYPTFNFILKHFFIMWKDESVGWNWAISLKDFYWCFQREMKKRSISLSFSLLGLWIFPSFIIWSLLVIERHLFSSFGFHFEEKTLIRKRKKEGEKIVPSVTMSKKCFPKLYSYLLTAWLSKSEPNINLFPIL